MGLTKQYLSYQAIDSFNIINSSRCNVNFMVYNRTEGRYILTAAAENAIVWDLRMGTRALTLRRDKKEVTALRASTDHMHVAVGYADGVVEIFDMNAPERSICSMALHKSAITILRYDQDGMRLIVGSLDTELTVVDVIEQSGRQRLIGHNAPVTDAYFLQRLAEQHIAVSSSKDTQIKFWNLETQFCFKTIVDNRTEVWALAFVDDFMIAGCSESNMKVYQIKRRDAVIGTLESAVDGLSIDDDAAINPISVSNCGEILRATKGRIVNLIADPLERVISCHGNGDLIETFYFCTEDEAKHRLAKRLKKLAKKEAIGSNVSHQDTDAINKRLSLSDRVKRLENIKTKQKVKSIDLLLSEQGELRVVVGLANNSVNLYSLDVNLKRQQKTQAQPDEKVEGYKLLRSLARMGHQSEVRSVCFSSDSMAVASGAGESLKLWNRESMQCIHTVPSNYILSCVFVPGDRYVLLGLKCGKLIIVDAGNGDVVEEIAAHDSELWSIVILPDHKGCVTSSSDKTVKIWTFELIDNPLVTYGMDSSTMLPMKILSLLHKNTLKLEEAVLAVRVSSDMKYLTVALLDSTVKIFFLDSFKFFLSLYGHKLPVLCLDIAYDSTIIATGSTDRNVKVWGLDFGDCHRSMFAHDDSVMALQFIPKTHMFFTCGKDGKIKQWDGDTFEKIITLNGHIGEAYNLAVSPNGKYLITCGSDRTLRLYHRTDEPIVLKDVQEQEREEYENQHLATGEDSVVPMLPGLRLASRKTIGAEMAAESIMECLDVCRQFDADMQADEKSDLHPLMLALQVTNTDDFLLTTIERIRSSDLEEALLILPFSEVTSLIHRLPQLVERRCDEIELLCKVTIFLFKVHLKPITSSKTLKPLLDRLIALLKCDVTNLRDIMGLNLHALGLLQHDFEENEGCELFHEVTQEHRKLHKHRGKSTKRFYTMR